jgi:NAD(P)-dependent dehydrogenase (short-subunit alcohol dehydrogenase family)
MARAALGPMLDAGSGSLVHVASIRAHLPDPQQADYSATKAAIVSLSKSIALEFTGRGIRSNAVSPGSIRTPAWDAPGGIGDALAARYGLHREDAIRHEMTEVRRVPAGRLGSVEEVASVIGFLVSEESSYVSGAEFTVDGCLIPTT